MSLKIVFMGTPEFSVPILKSINNSKHKILSVYTQPPKKKSRGQKIKESPVHIAARKLGLQVRCPDKIDSEKEKKFIKELKPDIVVVVAYGQIIPKEILKLSDIKFLNIHASLLPKWRGAAPIQRAIMNMDKQTGISFMKIVDQLDAGPVMKFVTIEIDKEITYENLSKKLSLLSSREIINCLDILEQKKEKFIPQDNSKATYAKKINKLETKLNWNFKAQSVLAKINALCPEPGTWFELNGFRIKILKAIEIIAKGNPGEIIDENFTIACSENAIRILELKKEGKNSMSASNFLIGNKLKVGTNLNEI